MIRTAQPRDLARILEIYDYARGFMERTGNASQWGKHFPPEELLREDIRAQRLFVIEEDGAVHGVFAFIIGDDPTYQTIEQGSWLAGGAYGTIHRIAGTGRCTGCCAGRSISAGSASRTCALTRTKITTSCST